MKSALRQMQILSVVVTWPFTVAAQVVPLAPHLVQATHIVAPAHPNATDTNNPTGSLVRPRLTIPNPVPACAIIDLFGTYPTPHNGASALRSLGTPSCPVVIRSADPATPSVITGHMEITGSTYTTFASLKWDRAGPNLVAPNTHVVVRDSEMVGTPASCTGTAVVSYTSGTFNREVTLYRNKLHHNGDVNAPNDQDCHGIVIGARAEDIYVQENAMWLNSGDGIQINSGSERSIRRVWVAGNLAYQNKQAGFWTKQAEHVIFAQNTCHSHRPSNSSLGACMGGQYGPEHAWFVNNRIHSSDYGIQIASDVGDGADGQYQFVVGNAISQIHDSNASFNSNTAWQDCAVSVVGGQHTYVIANSIGDVDSGVCVPRTTGTVQLYANAIQQVRPDGYHLFVEHQAVANTMTGAAGTFFAPTYRLRIGHTTTETPCCQSGQNSIVSAIGWSNLAARDFRLVAGAPVIDKGTGALQSLISYFASLYGTSIAQDIFGTARPVGAGFDSGATERP